MKVAVILVNIAGPTANSALGIATPEAQRSYYQAVIDDINTSSGVACRQLVAQYFQANPADQSDLRRKCLDIAEAGVFAVLDAGAYAGFPLMDCYAQHKIPYFGSYLLAKSQQREHYPYLFAFNLFDTLYRDTVFGLRDRGFFSTTNGFKKLGFIYRSCDQPLVRSFKQWLGEAGVPSSSVVTYDIGCPTGMASPSDHQQAVLKFKQNGVTHLTDAQFFGDIAQFSRVAQQQGFKPKYGLADDSLVPLSYGAQPPDPDNFDGAVVISASRDGEERTPGTKPSAGTVRCNKILAKKGLGPTYSLPASAGNACDNVWMFAAAVDHAPSLRVDALAAGLQAAKSVDFSYPQGPTDFTKAGTTFGGQFWRPLKFLRECACWRILDHTFRRTYP